MLRKESLMKKIVNCLSCLTVCVQQNNKLGWTDVNHGAEDFYCGLLNRAFGWKLRNQNGLQMDFPAIDLADEENHICVQVTSTTDRSKVQRTLDKFFAHELDAKCGYTRLILLVMGQKPGYRDPFTVKIGFDFDPRRDIWDISTLIKRLHELDLDTLEQVAAYLESQLDLPSPNTPVLKLPLPNTLDRESFVGREEELAELRRKLEDNSRGPVFVTGLGGMGKTELVTRFCADYAGGNVYFVRFRDSFTDTVALGMAAGLPGYAQRKPDPKQDYAAVLELLKSCGTGDILVIDNADEKDNDFSKLRKDPAWAELAKLDMRLVITTRCNLDRAVEVGAMEKRTLRAIFDNHGVPLKDTEKDALIDAVRRHTMTVDLMARTLKHNRTLTAARLLQVMRDGTLPEQKLRRVGVDRNGDPAQEQIYVHLRNLFQVAKLSKDDKTLLRWAVLLPEGGFQLDYLLAALPEELETLPDAQMDRGWLNYDPETGLVTIHPVIRLVCREELKPDDENCGEFLGALWDQFSRREYDAVKYRQLADLFSQASEILPDEQGSCAIKAGVLWDQVGLAGNALRFEERAVRQLEQSMPDSLKLATAYNNLGSTYGDLGNHNKALEYKQKALAIREKVLPSDHPSLALSYNNVGGTYGELGDHQKALENQLKALAIREKVLPADHPDLAISYNNVGGTYGELGDHQKALEYHLKALSIREQALPANHPDLASSYNNVGSTYGDLGDHQKALKCKLKALAIWEKVLPANHPDLATSYNNVGFSYGKVGDGEKELTYYIRALNIREKVLPANHPDLLSSYNNVGYTYGALGEHEKALEYLLKALAIREKVLPSDHPDLATCYNNVGYTYGALGDHQKALEYQRKALAILEKALPENHPNLLASYNNVGITWAEQGNFEQALIYMKKALAIAERILPEGNTERQMYAVVVAFLEMRLAEQNQTAETV